MAAIGLPIIGYGLVYGRSSGTNYVVSIIGALILLGGLYAWAMEPSTEPEEWLYPGPAGEGHDGDSGQPALVGAPETPALGAGDGGDGGTAEEET